MGRKPLPAFRARRGATISGPALIPPGGIPVQEQVRPRVEERPPARAPGEALERPGRGPTDWWGGWRWGFTSILIIAGIAAALRIYQGIFTFPWGLDSSTWQFFWLWRMLVVVELVGVGIFTVLWWGWLDRKSTRLNSS